MWQDWMVWLERAQGSLGRWLADWLGGPLEVLSVMGVLAWALVVLLAVAAVLGAALAELRPWMPTSVDEQEVTLTEAEKTVLYGSRDRETVLTTPMQAGRWPTMEDDLTAPRAPKGVVGPADC